jgi:xanthine/uracil permease
LAIHIKGDTGKTALFALQWLGFAVASIMAVPVIVGSALGLDSAASASFAQRTMLFVGLFSFLQVYLGHRYPLLEGPGKMWFSVFAIMSLSAMQMGKPLAELRSDLVAGIILTGLTYLVLSVTGLAKKITKLFTPLVNGTFLILLPLLLSSTIIRGIIGGESFNARGFIVAMVALTVTVIALLMGGGYIQSFSILCGISAGWLLSLLIGANPPLAVSREIIALPAVFPWGLPTINYTILLNCFIVGILILSNHVASTVNMSNYLNEELEEKRYAYSLAVTGLGNIFAAVFGITPFIPYASSIGFIRLTGNSKRLPFILCSLILVMLGLFPAVGGLIAAIPQQLGYAVLLIGFCQIFGLGLREYAKLSFDNKELLVCSLSVMTAVGIMFLPVEVVSLLHPSLRLIFGNGLIMGIAMCILLERMLSPMASTSGSEKIESGV